MAYEETVAYEETLAIPVTPAALAISVMPETTAQQVTAEPLEPVELEVTA
jgi:hypothetical protein